MNILIIGGTVFPGRRLVQAAEAPGHAVTLFNRRSRGENGCEPEYLLTVRKSIWHAGTNV